MSSLLLIYRAAGFELGQGVGERPDHVGVVLEFLALLESEKRNLSPELLSLITDPIKQFAKALGKATEHPLYQKVAGVLTDMAESEWAAGKQKQI
jgi:nitrate reductase assembly molybdenum cofactor insertion protein NarJ